MFSNSNVTTSTREANAAERIEIVEGGGDLDVGDLAGRRIAVGRRRARDSPCAGRRWRTCDRAGPPPEDADVDPGRMRASLQRLLTHRLRALPSRNAFSRSRRSGRVAAEQRHGEAGRRWWRPPCPIAIVADRDAAGHLDDRQERIEAVQRPALDRHADHGDGRLRRRPSRAGAPRRPRPAMMTCSPRALGGARRTRAIQLRRAMCRHDAALVRHLEARRASRPHAFIVSQSDATAHDDPDERGGVRRHGQSVSALSFRAWSAGEPEPSTPCRSSPLSLEPKP